MPLPEVRAETMLLDMKDLAFHPWANTMERVLVRAAMDVVRVHNTVGPYDGGVQMGQAADHLFRVCRLYLEEQTGEST